MTPLEAMTRLQAADPFVMNERAGTAFCFACGSYDMHEDDCPVLVLPQIVRALEDAETARYQCLGCAATVTEPLKKVQE